MNQNKIIYFKGLNGIRAIAAIGVMFSHINIGLKKYAINSFSLFGFNNNAQRGWSLGEHGVTMFFVLSGFLITYLLLIEKNKNQVISQKKFYIRRVLRIWPLYYLYLLLAIGLIYFLSISIPNSLFFYIFLLANIPFVLEKALPVCDHLWSIAVEEQFYLFWPFLFKKKINLERLLIIAIFLFIMVRFLLWLFLPFKFITILFTVNRFDCMMFGGLVAVFYQKKTYLVNFVLKKPIQFLAWIIVGIHIANFEIINSIISLELMTLATGIIICGQISNKNKIVNLENRLLNFLGKYSYGIYIYHPFFIYLFSILGIFRSVENEFIRMCLVFLSVILFTIATAFISYQLIEKRFIKLKDNFSIIHSTNSKN